jgi:hypothetical protein
MSRFFRFAPYARNREFYSLEACGLWIEKLGFLGKKL